MVFKIAWRSIWRNRRRTLITVFSIVLGLTIGIFFIALGEGVYDRMIDQAVRMQAGHITVQHEKYADAPAVDLFVSDGGLRARIEALPQVETTKLLVVGQGIVQSGAGSLGAGIMGVEPSVEAETSPLARNIVKGSFLEDGDMGLVVIGSVMADRLNLDVSKKLVVTTNDINGDLISELARVKGIFKTGSDEMDAYFLQTSIGFARKIFNMPENGVTQIAVLLESADDQTRVMREIGEMPLGPGAAVLPWQEVMPDVAAYVKVDRASNYVFQGLLIFLILFTIFNTILMSVLERQREFGMLLALGTPPGQLKRQILMETALIGLIGCLAGVSCGGLAVYLGHVYGIDFSSIMGENVTISGFAISTVMHPKLSAVIVFRLAAIVFAATMMMSLPPMRRAAGVNITDALR